MAQRKLKVWLEPDVWFFWFLILLHVACFEAYGSPGMVKEVPFGSFILRCSGLLTLYNYVIT